MQGASHSSVKHSSVMRHVVHMHMHCACACGALHGASADLEGESALGLLIVLARGGGDVGGLVVDADDVGHMAGPAHHLHSQRRWGRDTG